MRLTEGEKAVLDCYLCGMGHSEIARYLNVNRTTVWNRRNKLRIKCRDAIKSDGIMQAPFRAH